MEFENPINEELFNAGESISNMMGLSDEWKRKIRDDKSGRFCKGILSLYCLNIPLPPINSSMDSPEKVVSSFKNLIYSWVQNTDEYAAKFSELANSSFDLNENIKTVIEQLEMANKDALAAKDETIGKQDILIKEYKQKSDEYKERSDKFEKKCVDLSTARSGSVQPDVLQTQYAAPPKKKFMLFKNNKSDDQVELDDRYYLKKQKDLEKKRFMDIYMDSTDYGDDAKNFLLDCFSSGYSLDKISQFARPNLSVDLMKELKDL